MEPQNLLEQLDAQKAEAWAHVDDFYNVDAVFDSREGTRLFRPNEFGRTAKALWSDHCLAHVALQQMELSQGSDLESYDEAVAFLRRNGRDVDARYWGIHQDAYVARIDGLIQDLNESRFMTDETKVVVVLAAMNETEVARAIDALKRSYGENFARDIAVLVYNNFKTERADADILASLEDAQLTYPNIAIINEQVPSYSTVAMAKKVASDCALRYMQRNGRSVPLVFTDADVVGLSRGDIQEAVEILQNGSNGILAVTTNYIFDPEARRRFPNWGIVEDFRIALLEANKSSEANLIGPFYAILPNVLENLGGIYGLATFEDSALSEQLKDLTGSRNRPVARLDGAVILAPSKELENLAEGKAGDNHWQGDNEPQYKDTSGRRRLDWETVSPLDDPPPELMGLGKKLNPLYAVARMNDFWQRSIRFTQWGNAVRYTRPIIDFFNDREIEIVLDVERKLKGSVSRVSADKLTDITPGELDFDQYDYKVTGIKLMQK